MFSHFLLKYLFVNIIPFTNSSVFKELNIPAPRDGWHIALKVIDGERVGNEEILQKYEAAANVLKAFSK